MMRISSVRGVALASVMKSMKDKKRRPLESILPTMYIPFLKSKCSAKRAVQASKASVISLYH